MKRVISIVLVIAILFSLSARPNVLATDSATLNTDRANYRDFNGDLMTIEKLDKQELFSNDETEGIYKTRIFRNGQYEETIIVDFKTDRITHEYANGKVQTDVLSDIVTITPIVSSEDLSLEAGFRNFAIPLSGVDYVDDEPFVINSSGIQEPLSGALVYSGYSAMGGRGGYYYAPYIYGYLQRQNSGTIGTSYGKRFSFSPGTVIGTAASIIVAAILEANSLWEVALSVVVSLLGAVVDTVLYDWSVDFKKKTYKWSYRVRLNSNTGQIIYNKYRTKDFWLAYNVATGVAKYEYAAGFDEGFLSANTELIKAAIDTYLENNPQ